MNLLTVFYLYRFSFDVFYYSLNMRVCLFRCPLCQDRSQKSDVQKYQKVGIFFLVESGKKLPPHSGFLHDSSPTLSVRGNH